MAKIVYPRKQYSAIRRLAILSYGSHRFMLVLRAYCDESGDASDPKETVVSMGGCVAPLESWEAFEKDWKVMLADFGLEGKALHMNELAHFRGDFEGCGEEKRRAILRAAINLIDRDVSAFIGAAIYLPDFFSLDPMIQERARDPYYVCFQLCAKSAAIQTLEDPAEKVEMILSMRSGVTRNILNLYSRLKYQTDYGEKLGSVSFDSPKDLVQLQAADLVVYELHHLTKARIFQEPNPDPNSIRWPMRQLLDHSPERTFFYTPNRQNLEEWTMDLGGE